MADKGLGFPDNLMALFGLERTEIEPPTIPDDVCRCMDSDCVYHSECARWVNRYRGDGRISMSATLWEPDDNGMCTSFVDEVYTGEKL